MRQPTIKPDKALLVVDMPDGGRRFMTVGEFQQAVEGDRIPDGSEVWGLPGLTRKRTRRKKVVTQGG